MEHITEDDIKEFLVPNLEQLNKQIAPKHYAEAYVYTDNLDLYYKLQLDDFQDLMVWRSNNMVGVKEMVIIYLDSQEVGRGNTITEATNVIAHLTWGLRLGLKIAKER